MLAYPATKSGFRAAIDSNQIDAMMLAKFTRRLGESLGEAELKSWRKHA